MNNCTKERCPFQGVVECSLEECPYKTEPQKEIENRMSKYINADEFKKELRKRYKAGIIGKNTLICEFKAINEMPAADVRENKHGEWVNPAMGYEDCSVCGYCFAVYDEHDHYNERNFCPNCGADMRERKDEK